MVAITFVQQRLTPNLALVAAGGLAVFVALGMLVLPGALLEDLVVASGIAAFIPAAEPPLGATARICVAVFAGGGVGLAAWFGLSTLVELLAARKTDGGKRRPAVRRADAHPDAPPREPLRAGRDLGFDLSEAPEPVEALQAEPLELSEPEPPREPVIAMGAPAPASIPVPVDIPVPPPVVSPPPVQSLPCDLDQPLAAFDPGALLDTPFTPPPPVTPLRRKPVRAPVFDAGERFETFELTRPARTEPAAPPLAAPETAATVHALLNRLERGIVRRSEQKEAAPVPSEPHGLEDTLDALRRMAIRA